MQNARGILVVDDDPDLVEVIGLLLEKAGYEVRSACNGHEALCAVESKRPSLVLLDMLMPVMDGYQCAKELRSRYGHSINIVIVTAAEHAGAMAAELEVDHVVCKPFEIQELLRVVSRYARQTHR